MCNENKKIAVVYKGQFGYWEVWDDKTNKRIGNLFDTELAAYKAANYKGYIVR